MSSVQEIIIQGICYDEKSSYLRGAAKAPSLIRNALYSGSMNLCSEKGLEISDRVLKDLGDFEIRSYHEIEEITLKNISASGAVLTLGGDHSISFPIIKALAKRHKRLDLLQIDAHTDLYDEFEGDRFSHACPFARIMEQGLVAKLVQVGIRSLTPHQLDQAERYDVEIHQMRTLDLSKMSKFKNPVYLSLDLDGIDPAFAPGVSHHEPGGLTSRQVIDLIQNLEAEIVGADIVEYNPDRDISEMTAFLAAKLMKEILVRMMYPSSPR